MGRKNIYSEQANNKK